MGWVFTVPSATVLTRFCNIQEARSERECCSAEAELVEWLLMVCGQHGRTYLVLLGPALLQCAPHLGDRRGPLASQAGTGTRSRVKSGLSALAGGLCQGFKGLVSAQNESPGKQCCCSCCCSQVTQLTPSAEPPSRTRLLIFHQGCLPGE